MNQINPLFTQFVKQTTNDIAAGHDEATLLAKISASLKTLLGKPGWLPDAYIKPRQDRYAQYPLYVASDASWSVVSFVWLPGQWTPIHDHTVWGVVGIHQGIERTEAIRAIDGRLQVTKTIDAGVGEVGAVSPRLGDIHRVGNVSDDLAVSIHVYGADIGRIERHVFDEQSARPSSFVSGYEALQPLVA